MHQGNGLQSRILTLLLEYFFEYLVDVYRRYDKVFCVLNSPREEIGVAAIDISMARDKRITERNDLFEDRRPEEYSLLTQQRSKKKEQ